MFLFLFLVYVCFCEKENESVGLIGEEVDVEEELCFVRRREGRESGLFSVLERRICCFCYFGRRRRLGENGMR